jgi:hypothetical protein
MGWRFSELDLEQLRNETGIPVGRLRGMLVSRESLSSFNVPQLKNLIRFLKTKTRVHINVTGTKDKLIFNIASIIFSSENNEPLGENVTIEHNVHVKQSPLQPVLYVFVLISLLDTSTHFIIFVAEMLQQQHLH